MQYRKRKNGDKGKSRRGKRERERRVFLRHWGGKSGWWRRREGNELFGELATKGFQLGAKRNGTVPEQRRKDMAISIPGREKRMEKRFSKAPAKEKGR